MGVQPGAVSAAIVAIAAGVVQYGDVLKDFGASHPVPEEHHDDERYTLVALLILVFISFVQLVVVIVGVCLFWKRPAARPLPSYNISVASTGSSSALTESITASVGASRAEDLTDAQLAAYVPRKRHA